MARCTAKAKSTGNQCKKPAIKGTTVCREHGGTAPQTLAKAKQRLLEAADPAAAELARIAQQGKDESTRVRAINSLLDRAGIPKSTRHEVDARVEHDLESVLAQIRDAYSDEEEEE